MKKTTIIGCSIFTIAIVVLFAVIYMISYDPGITNEQEKKAKMIADSEVCYYIFDTDGYVTVYLADQKTVFEFTSIETSSLPLELQNELKHGIKAESVGEVYGFLENYSS